MENIQIGVLRGLFSNDKIPNEFIFEMFGEGIITNIEKTDNENKGLSSTILQLEKKLKDAEEVIHFFQNRKECAIDGVEETEEIILSKTYIDTFASPREVFDINYYINECIRIEKKVAFYNIRQLHFALDLKYCELMSNPRYSMPCTLSPRFNNEVDISRLRLIMEYMTRINNIDSSIFKKMSSELPIYTKVYHTLEYDSFERMKSIESINIIDYRNDNNGYIIDNSFIEELITDICDYLPFKTMCEIKLTEIAYELHNIFYEKIKDAYENIEEKYLYRLQPCLYTEAVMNELHDNEIEEDILEEFDYKRRKLQLREFKARGYHIHRHPF